MCAHSWSGPCPIPAAGCCSLAATCATNTKPSPVPCTGRCPSCDSCSEGSHLFLAVRPYVPHVTKVVEMDQDLVDSPKQQGGQRVPARVGHAHARDGDPREEHCMVGARMHGHASMEEEEDAG